MTQLVLQPCGDDDAVEHYVDTIENPVPLERISRFLPEADRARIARTLGDSVAIWGVTPGKRDMNANKWHRMELGDIALMYRERRFFFKGEVAYKIRSADMARELWGERKDGATWEYAFFLTDLEEVDIDVRRFNIAAGYKENNVVQGFDVLPRLKSDAVLDALDLSSAIGAVVVTPPEADAARRRLLQLGQELDLPVASRRRAEQSLLREIMLGSKREAPCALCSRILPIDLLVVGHIRKRHSCDASQKLDEANTMPICLLGCDKLFENGYVNVDDRGTVCAANGRKWNPALSEALNAIVGRQCAAWSPASEIYFKWHREHRRRFL